MRSDYEKSTREKSLGLSSTNLHTATLSGFLSCKWHLTLDGNSGTTEQAQNADRNTLSPKAELHQTNCKTIRENRYYRSDLRWNWGFSRQWISVKVEVGSPQLLSSCISTISQLPLTGQKRMKAREESILLRLCKFALWFSQEPHGKRSYQPDCWWADSGPEIWPQADITSSSSCLLYIQ